MDGSQPTTPPDGSPGIHREEDGLASAGDPCTHHEPPWAYNETRGSHTQPPSLSILQKPLPGIISSNQKLLAEPNTPATELPQFGGLNSRIRTESPRRYHLGVLREWWLEILACVLLTGALFAIFAVIYSYQGLPLPQWPYSISINTLIAFIVVVMKGSILVMTSQGLSQLKWTWFNRKRPLQDLTRYDMASRGPWGSVRLLVSLRGRHFVASMGAVITVCALILDPFAQQLVKYHDCRIAVPAASASIPRTNYYAGDPYFADMSTSMNTFIRAINAGVFIPGAFTIPFTCSTGNCSFNQLYHSVGHCSSCVDITKDLKIYENNTGISVTDYVNDANYGPNYRPVTWINTTLPSGLNATFVETGDPVGSTSFVMGNGEPGVQAILGVNPYAYNIALDYCPNWGCGGAGAAQCSIFPCVRTYNATVENGKLMENLVGTSSNFGLSSDISNFATVSVDCLSPQESQALKQAGYSVDDGTGWIAYNGSTAPRTSTLATQSFPNANCTYIVNYDTNSNIQNFFGIYFTGSISIYRELYPASKFDVIYNSGNVSLESLNSTFQNISDSLTTYIRQIGAVNWSAPAMGQILREETCVHVRWAWLIYPASLVLLSLTFFVFMLIETTAEQHYAHDWKSSPLPLMFHGLDEDTLDNHDTSNLIQVHEMEKTAGSVLVRLSPTEKGWKFTKMD
jgi:hypothetical protein